MRRILAIILTTLVFSTFGFSQGNSANAPGHTGKTPRGEANDDDHDDNSPVQVGWAIVTPLTVTAGAGTSTVTTSASSSGLVVFETFGLKRGDDTTQAGLLPGDLTTNSIMFVNAHGSLSRNLGIGIVNPGSTAASVTMTLRKDDGAVIGTPKTISVGAGNQTAQFITAVFADRPEVPNDLTGTVAITSTAPVSMVGLRFRGVNFSTIPITNLSPSTAVPTRGAGIGGSGAVVLPHFAAGGGWATELVFVNTGTQRLRVRADFFKQDGTAMTVKLNGESKSSFTDLVIPAGGVLQLAPKDRDGHSRF